MGERALIELGAFGKVHYDLKRGRNRSKIKIDLERSIFISSFVISNKQAKVILTLVENVDNFKEDL